jgi:NAD+ kinase
VAFESQTAATWASPATPRWTWPAIGAQCDLGLVVGGDGTMLGIGRQLARYGVPLIGINQGRLGSSPTSRFDGYQQRVAADAAGAYEEDHRSLMQARVCATAIACLTRWP